MDVTPACSACVRADAAEQLQSFVEGLLKSFGSGSTNDALVNRWMNVSKSASLWWPSSFGGCRRTWSPPSHRVSMSSLNGPS